MEGEEGSLFVSLGGTTEQTLSTIPMWLPEWYNWFILKLAKFGPN